MHNFTYLLPVYIHVTVPKGMLLSFHYNIVIIFLVNIYADMNR